MPQQITTAIENNFTKGLITESTGLNFPENAATSTDNCQYTLIGDVARRLGIDYETNFQTKAIDRSGCAISMYKWNNVGGDGLTQVVVFQVGANLYFYPSSSTTNTHPLSTFNAAIVPINMVQFQVSSFNIGNECQFADGNGYLFVYHPNCDPFFVSYSSGILAATKITVQIRDFNGIVEPGVAVNNRPLNLTNQHLYNLTNQGWTKGSPWQGVSADSVQATTGVKVFTVAAALPVTLGDRVTLTNSIDGFPGGVFQPAGSPIMSGTVTAYAGVNLTITVTWVSSIWTGAFWSSWFINPTSIGFIDTWKTAIGNYPSNADVWWYFKNTSGVYDPATQIGNVTFNSGPAPKGHYIVQAFNQLKSGVSAIAGLTDVTTTLRPKTGTWFQGRVWYTGVDAQQPPTGDASYYTWTENIYFSQIIVDATQFGNCFQTNDPTSETFFGLLPTDGGVITIQGSGSIFKLFPIQNGMLVFAANGVWFITGSQGIGFTANDYTITKISAIQSISSTSFVDVQGLPYFWNEEGIYSVKPAQGGALQVEAITVGTILSFYNEIPLSSKKYARAAYHPIDYTIQWIYSGSEPAVFQENYEFDKILNFNTYNKAFFPYTVANNNSGADPWINGILYVTGPGGANTPPAMFKYLASKLNVSTYNFTFADEHDTDYRDWSSINNDQAFGDSVTFSIAATDPSLGYVNLLSQLTGRSITNHGVSGDMVPDGASQVYATSLTAPDRATLMYGINDERIYGVDATKQEYYRRGLQALVAWNALGTRQLGTGQGIYTGTWLPTAVYGIGKTSTTLGDTATFTVSGTTVYLGMIQQDGAPGTFDVKIDGVTVGSYTTQTFGLGPTVNGVTYGPMLLRYPNLIAGSHTVQVIVTSATAPANHVYIDWVAGNSQTIKPYVFVGNVLKAQTYPSGGSAANVDAYNVSVASLVADLIADGLNVSLVDVANLLDLATDMDGAYHPINSGHVKLAAAFAAAEAPTPLIMGGFNYDSFFITGYKIRGQAIRKFQPQYIQMYSRTNDVASAYKIQGLWDYSNSGNSGRWSSEQLVTNGLTQFDTVYRRHKIRGRGFALQFKISSADGLPFDIQGWAVVDTVNTGT